MTDTPARSRHSNTLGLRLALAFLGVALAAVALNAVLDPYVMRQPPPPLDQIVHCWLPTVPDWFDEQ